MLPPANGRVDCSDGINFQSVCTFTCNSGFELDAGAEGTSDGLDTEAEVTSLKRTCTSDSEWTDNGPIKCKSKPNIIYEITLIFS